MITPVFLIRVQEALVTVLHWIWVFTQHFMKGGHFYALRGLFFLTVSVSLLFLGIKVIRSFIRL